MACESGETMKRRPRRNHTPAFTAEVALAAIKGDRTLAQLAEQFDVHPNQITTWKAQLESAAADVFDPGGRGSEHQPWQHLLPATAGAGSRSRDHAASRSAAPGVPLRRLANAERPAGCRWVQDRPPACENADAADGDRGALSPSGYNHARARPQDLPVSAAGDGDYAAKPSLGDGHHVHSDGAGLRLSRRCARLVQPPCVVVAVVDYNGGVVLRGDT